MKTTLKTKQGSFTINSTYIGDKPAPWDEKKQNYNNHTLVISHKGKRLNFEFWASIMHPEMQSDSDNVNTFQCFVSDALSAHGNSFKDFCSEFGYDTDSRKAEKVYKACQKAASKLNRIFDGDIYELANELQELENAN